MSDNLIPLVGGCLCGAVRYEAREAPQRVINCHCADCQKATGSVYGTLLFIPDAALTVSGELTYYSHKADSGSDMRKGFCGTCGAQVLSYNSSRQGVVALRAGSLDDKAAVAPQANIFTKSAVPSTHMDPDLPPFAGMPT